MGDFTEDLEPPVKANMPQFVTMPRSSGIKERIIGQTSNEMTSSHSPVSAFQIRIVQSQEADATLLESTRSHSPVFESQIRIVLSQEADASFFQSCENTTELT
ncbi:hypothetical protein NW764_016586 [Fusarium oxysporum]|nr:hypothetical protein NW764_016586 [Fusarium oxysporum]